MFKLRSINPATGEENASYDVLPPNQLPSVIEQSAAAFKNWRTAPIETRAAKLRAMADLLDARSGELARLMAIEMGKPIRQGRQEAQKCALACRYYSEHAEAFLAPDVRKSDAAESFIRFDPLGPLLAVMPWNFPLWQVIRFAAPALAAGNTVLLKHASNVPGCALAIEKLFLESGLPEGVFQTILISSGLVEQVIRDVHVCGVSITGSTQAGRKVAAAAGDELKQMVMELGGSDPFIVLADADIEQAVKVGVQSRCINSGQSCIAAKRFIVEESVAETFVDRFVSLMREQKVGDPLAEETDIGPLVHIEAAKQLKHQVDRAVEQGARKVFQDETLWGTAAFFPPTVLTHVSTENTAWTEELFGPVAAFAVCTGPEHAVQLANRSRYGLGAAIWSRDVDRAKRLAAEIESGAVFINEIVKSDPRLPFGGVKESGFGRELSIEGIRSFVNVKTVWVGSSAG